ncbi:hypothetical protein SAMN05216241_1075 [Limimonas halophila]|uniref:Copper(I)-binding protein n=1 Tax=Limimonas halophila TaxID=1082479 RepID=A0A1G7SH63_9PROT|nr:copper chaperone PCu(A)C [Limimonas halophila]SDG22281.1 hypothetical protein SAMN05216241_1075 [Limimonas halophila]
MPRFAALALALMLPAAALAHSAKEGAIQAGHAWAPPAADGATMVFVPLANDGDAPRELVRVTTPVAAEAFLRNGTGSDAERLESLRIDAGGFANLARWREHIRLTGLTRALGKGDRFPLTLHFADQPPLKLTIIVESQPGH